MGNTIDKLFWVAIIGFFHDTLGVPLQNVRWRDARVIEFVVVPLEELSYPALGIFNGSEARDVGLVILHGSEYGLSLD